MTNVDTSGLGCPGTAPSAELSVIGVWTCIREWVRASVDACADDLRHVSFGRDDGGSRDLCLEVAAEEHQKISTPALIVHLRGAYPGLAVEAIGNLGLLIKPAGDEPARTQGVMVSYSLLPHGRVMATVGKMR
jgi:hypothetical protein